MLKDKKMGSQIPYFLLTCCVLLSFMHNAYAGVISSFIRSKWPSVDIPLDNEVLFDLIMKFLQFQGDIMHHNEPYMVYPNTLLSNRWSTLKPERTHHSEMQPMSDSDIFENYLRMERESRERNCILRTAYHCEEMQRKKMEEIELYNATINQAQFHKTYRRRRCFNCRQKGQILKMKKQNEEIEKIGNTSESAKPKPSDEVEPFKQYLHIYETPYAASESSTPLWYAVRRGYAHIIFLSSYSPYVKYIPHYKWLEAEFKKVDREKTPWLIVIMHSPMYNSKSAHYMEGQNMRVVFDSWFVKNKVDMVFAGHVHAYERSYRISNIHYNITGGVSYPVPDKSAPIYVTVGDGGNKEGLASTYYDPQPHYSAFREASYGHSTLEILNKTHAIYHRNRNDVGESVVADAFVLHNQYWLLKDTE